MTTQIDFTRLIGTRYGRLEVKAIGKKRVRWGVANYQYLLCACDCGKEKEIVYTSLLRGRTKSCGCLRAENFHHKKRHGHASNETERGEGKQSKEYMAWLNAIHYCEYPGSTYYPHIGGKGIKFDPTWREDFTAFLKDVGPAPGPDYKLSRKDKTKDYAPGNVSWVFNPSHKKHAT